ncbi:MAG: RecX family transcriptional regulator [Clostridia bacterium]|nr:RecX family transcriptional regulator [Clostridia bacterium]
MKGFSRSASEAAVELCESKGYIDESALATRRAELMVAKPWGRTRIFAKLREEGYSDAAMEAVAEYLDEVDFSEGCEKVIEKKFTCVPKERREREKMYASLSRLGFSSADIKAAISRIKRDE